MYLNSACHLFLFSLIHAFGYSAVHLPADWMKRVLLLLPPAPMSSPSLRPPIDLNILHLHLLLCMACPCNPPPHLSFSRWTTVQPPCGLPDLLWSLTSSSSKDQQLWFFKNNSCHPSFKALLWFPIALRDQIKTLPWD